ncbi:MAG TPA: anthranilate phosphoribosyltransferase [Kofleriaceae bacterium]|nr:anthranilate phosphoribosyltransferase [Kofleriaceae bacterium]
MSVQRAIARVLEREDLSRADMAEVIGIIMDGQATPAQIGGLLVALRAKGETVDELVGAAEAMRGRALAIACHDHERSIDTCGTGGDGAGTVNVSTLAAIVVAACGGVVAKHGNRAQSSRCGSADVLEALGIGVDADPAHVEASLRAASIGFMFAPRFHAATRHAAGPRKELGTRTIFNLLGPLTNPARVRHQVVGVFAAKWCEPMAAALGALGVRRAAVVHGAGGPSGIDELAARGQTFTAIWDEAERSTRTLVLTPASFGARDADPAGLAGGDAAHNAAIATDLFAGRGVAEAVRTSVAMTAALALEMLQPGALELGRLPAHYARATAAMLDGGAKRVLEQWREASRA